MTMFAHACRNWHTLNALKSHSFTEYEHLVMFLDAFPVEFGLSTKIELLQFVEHGSAMLPLEYTVLGLARQMVADGTCELPDPTALNTSFHQRLNRLEKTVSDTATTARANA